MSKYRIIMTQKTMEIDGKFMVYYTLQKKCFFSWGTIDGIYAENSIKASSKLKATARFVEGINHVTIQEFEL